MTLQTQLTPQQLVDLSTNNTLAIQGINQTIINHQQRITSLESEVKELRDTSEITNSQAKQLHGAVRKLAVECVGYPHRLYRLVIMDIWKYLKEYYHVAIQYKETEKVHFKGALEGLENYQFNLERIEKRYQAIQDLKNE